MYMYICIYVYMYNEILFESAFVDFKFYIRKVIFNCTLRKKVEILSLSFSKYAAICH